MVKKPSHTKPMVKFIQRLLLEMILLLLHQLIIIFITWM